ncbi:cellulose synthase-like protein H1 isoform X2 [Phoenix dactylifera]|uniref:Cellulose synthase-like protein H1 isoform X2 n=1 Tax=Phoenix dactylifera TaxID=42345 RepID=A0A8B9ART4_PHODC|nr:cellulose synthase-like protein H1 isoform X2 [Phoenix dactylifera]
MATHHNLPLQERISLKNTFQRVSSLLILALLLSLLLYRLTSLHSHGSIWLIAFLCESWFTFIWVLYMNAKWNPVKYKTYPELLLKRSDDLPAVDMFVTTADPKLEPPIITANTVLSLLAVEYPAHKLACYVSDDGSSPMTFYSLVEASKFAKLWVPFCKKYNVRVRAPFVYFSSEPQAPQTLLQEFMDTWRYMKNKYEELSQRIDDAAKDYISHRMDDELADFSNIERGNHPSLIKVIWENKEGLEGGIPHLVYVAREKRPKLPHHYKAGAMNVLARVSGVMTNAPFMLNVDCDMFANHPEVILHGMCLLLGFDNEVSSGFVQAPQQFYGALKDDPFGNQLVVLQEITVGGTGGLQGPFYGGTGCFHRRKIICSTPRPAGVSKHDELSYNELQRIYGDSRELIESASHITSGKFRESSCVDDLSSSVEAAKRVASCTYEFNTCWGNKIGWAYGSMTEDVLTGLRIHSMGSKSVCLKLDPPAFLGSAATGGPASLTQNKRWSTGLLEILLTRRSPILATFTKQLEFRMCLAYLLVIVWALRSIGELCYALLPAYCLIANTSFMPKASEPVFVIPLALFLICNMHSLMEYVQCGLSVRAYWNNQRMNRIFAMTAWLLGLLAVLLKTLGLSETVFEVTRKDQQSDTNDTDKDPGRFTFDNSPLFVSGTAVLLANLAALTVGLLRLRRPVVGPGLGEFVCSVWVVLSLWPFARGRVGRGSYGIPWPVIRKAAVLASLFVQFSVLERVH